MSTSTSSTGKGGGLRAAPTSDAEKLREERRFGLQLLTTKAVSKNVAERLRELQARKVASVPEDVFEAYLRDDPRPSRAGLLRAAGLGEPKRKRKRRRGNQMTLTGKLGLSHDAEVINWVRQLYRAGWDREEIVEASKNNTDGWPRPGKSLTNGGISECRAVISVLEAQGVRFPLPLGGVATQNGRLKNPFGKRLHVARGKRAAAHRQQDPDVVLWDAACEITNATGLLWGFDQENLLDGVEVADESARDTVDDLHSDLLMLREWQERVVRGIEGWLGEQALRKKIVALRSKTVENGCEAPEAESAQLAADRLEQRLNSRLGA